MLKYSKTSRSRSDRPSRFTWSQGARDFTAALLLLGAALYFALLSEKAVLRGESSLGIVLAVAALLLALITAVTVVPRLARRVDFSRWLMPVSFSITREGGVYLLILFIISLAAVNSGNNLLFMILAVLLSAIITSGVFARVSLLSVFVTMDVPENVFVGERVSIKVSLKNKKRFFPSVSITVEDVGRVKRTFPGAARNGFAFWKSKGTYRPNGSDTRVLQHTAYFPLISPGDVRTELISQTFPRRGRYHLEGFRISTRFPFSLFRRGERVRAEGEVLVYPRVQEVSSYFHLLPFQPGRIEGRHTGRGENLYSIRRYYEGENARLVDWKATAKTGELMARQFAREEESRFCLILDTLIHSAIDGAFDVRFEKAVSLAASLASHFSEEGAEFEFLTPSEYVPRGMGTGHLYRVLRSLAVVEYRTALESPSTDLRGDLSGIVDAEALMEILSEKTFKIIITSKPRGSFSSTIWRSSHVIYFDEL